MIQDDIYKYSMIFDSKEFQILNKKLNKFNPLKVLNSAKYEIRHSNIIGWLLDPNENHNIGGYFLQGFIAKCLSKEENIDVISKIDFDLKQVLIFKYNNIDVIREKKTRNNRRIDILVVDSINKVVILIENKFKGKESKNQLNDYLTFVRDEYSGFTIIPVFLTLSGLEATSEYYINLEYNDIINILDRILLVHGELIDKDVKRFIRDYMEIIKEETLGNVNEIELAMELYKQYKDVITDDFENFNLNKKELETINFIKNNGNNFMLQAFERFKERNKSEILMTNNTTRTCSFVLESFKIGNLKSIEKWWFNLPFVIWFEKLGDKRLKIKLELGPVEYESRIRIINNLELMGLKITNQAKRKESKYTSLYSNTVYIEDWTNVEEIYNSMIALYDFEILKDIINKIKKLDNKSE